MWIITDQSFFITRLGGGGNVRFWGIAWFSGEMEKESEYEGGRGELLKIDSQ